MRRSRPGLYILKHEHCSDPLLGQLISMLLERFPEPLHVVCKPSWLDMLLYEITFGLYDTKLTYVRYVQVAEDRIEFAIGDELREKPVFRPSSRYQVPPELGAAIRLLDIEQASRARTTAQILRMLARSSELPLLTDRSYQ